MASSFRTALFTMVCAACLPGCGGGPRVPGDFRPNVTSVSKIRSELEAGGGETDHVSIGIKQDHSLTLWRCLVKRFLLFVPPQTLLDLLRQRPVHDHQHAVAHLHQLGWGARRAEKEKA